MHKQVEITLAPIRYSIRNARLVGNSSGAFRGSREWTFAVDHPVTGTQRRQIGREGSCISECGVLSEELQLSCTMSGGELFEDQSSKQAQQHAYVEQEVGPASDPALTIERDAAARHDHMDVWMVSPGVEYGEEADAGAEVFGIGRYSFCATGIASRGRRDGCFRARTQLTR